MRVYWTLKSLEFLVFHIVIAFIVWHWLIAEKQASYLKGKLDAYVNFEASVPSYKGLEKW